VEPGRSPLGEPSLCLEVLNTIATAPPPEFEHIFERFKRASIRPGIEGSGLGLYVVHAIARAHGGDVTAELLEDGLVRFAFYLPLQCPVEARE